MAFLARHHGVTSDQRKSRDIVIEGRDAAPVVLAMATLTPDAKLALVPVILAMTRHTCCRQLVVVEIARVAGVALDLRMRGPQWIFRVLVMIKMDRNPLVLVVAGFAFGAIPSTMNILNPVAIDTCEADSGVALANMAR